MTTTQSTGWVAQSPGHDRLMRRTWHGRPAEDRAASPDGTCVVGMDALPARYLGLGWAEDITANRLGWDLRLPVLVDTREWSRGGTGREKCTFTVAPDPRPDVPLPADPGGSRGGPRLRHRRAGDGLRSRTTRPSPAWSSSRSPPAAGRTWRRTAPGTAGSTGSCCGTGTGGCSTAASTLRGPAAGSPPRTCSGATAPNAVTTGPAGVTVQLTSCRDLNDGRPAVAGRRWAS